MKRIALFIVVLVAALAIAMSVYLRGRHTMTWQENASIETS